MFFLIGKKKWLQLMNQFQLVQAAVGECRGQLNAIQKTRAELLRELEAIHEVANQAQKKLDAVEALSSALRDNIQANGTQTAAAMEQHAKLLSAQGTKAQEGQSELMSELENAQMAMAQIREKLGVIETASAGLQEGIRANGEQTTEEMKRIEKVLTDQLMLLDESSRLLLLHTVINELGVK